MVIHPLDFVSVWIFFSLTLIMAMFAIKIGYWAGRISLPKGEDSSIGVLVGALLALLAFLLGFAFSLASTRYENRRLVVLEEANSIGTTYLRTQLLPEPQRSEIQELLRKYVDIRVKAAAQKQVKGAELTETINSSTEIQNTIWQKAMSVAKENPTVMTALFVQTLNDMIDIHSKRLLVGVLSQIPMPIWFWLFGVSFISLVAAGFQAGITEKHRSLLIWSMGLVLAGVLTLVADLDHPSKGYLQNTQIPMINLQKSINPP